jgi:catechol 2,3-dioxygenase-like lactoylglutathione lyase family enzyme
MAGGSFAAPAGNVVNGLFPIALIVRDRDEATAWFKSVLGFTLIGNKTTGADRPIVS